MTQANDRAVIGGNNPPADPIDAITAQFEDDRAEAENWLDGKRVTNEAQMKAVDALRLSMRRFRLDLTEGQKTEAAPLHTKWKDALARWNPTIEDATKIEKGLVSLVDSFKKELADEKAAELREKQIAAAKAMREAEEAARAADVANIEQQREAEAKIQEAKAAQKAVTESKKDQVKGLRTVKKYRVSDYKAAINDIATNDRDALIAFVDEYARRNHTVRAIAGVETWEDKEAY